MEVSVGGMYRVVVSDRWGIMEWWNTGKLCLALTLLDFCGETFGHCLCAIFLFAVFIWPKSVTHRVYLCVQCGVVSIIFLLSMPYIEWHDHHHVLPVWIACRQPCLSCSSFLLTLF